MCSLSPISEAAVKEHVTLPHFLHDALSLQPFHWLAYNQGKDAMEPSYQTTKTFWLLVSGQIYCKTLNQLLPSLHENLPWSLSVPFLQQLHFPEEPYVH